VNDAGGIVMAVKLNRRAFEHAKQLVAEGHFVDDGRDAWSEDQASAEDENKFIEEYGFGAYGKWHLGVDDGEPEDTKARYKFPYGDFQRAHRCALLSAEGRAGQYKHGDIELAAAHLKGMMDQVNSMAAGA
jgi:hypothetical protein